MGCHTVPASVVFHTPPSTPPKKKLPSLPGTPLTATTRPARKGPTIRHRSPLNSSGEIDCANARTGTAPQNTTAIQSGRRRRRRGAAEQCVFIADSIVNRNQRLSKTIEQIGNPILYGDERRNRRCWRDDL